MSEPRHVRKVVRSRPTLEGAGVHLRRAIGFGDPHALDPFLLLDDFRSDEPAQYLKGFPWHPHRGIETITYVLRGDVEHGDSLGNRGVIGAGDVQWMTAGSGIIHQEMPKGDAGGSMHGFQLWANLPAARQDDGAALPRHHRRRRSPRSRSRAARGSGSSPARSAACAARCATSSSSPSTSTSAVPPGATFTHPTPRGHTVFAYVIGGWGVFCGQRDPYSYEIEGAGYFDMERAACSATGTSCCSTTATR